MYTVYERKFMQKYYLINKDDTFTQRTAAFTAVSILPV